MASWLYMIFSPTVVFAISFLIFVASLLWQPRWLLYLGLVWLLLALVLTIDFVSSYDSYAQASVHGAPIWGLLAGTLPIIGDWLGRFLARRLLRRHS